MKNIIIIILIFQSGLLVAQSDASHFTELQKIFFVSEIAGLASISNNPAGLSMRTNDDGIMIGYDFKEFERQGNSTAYFSSGNFGFSYQDVYNYNSVRLQNYSVNLSIGNESFSIGTANRLISARYTTYTHQSFSLDAGLIIQPAPFLSLGLLVRNINEAKIDSIEYNRNYTAGLGILLFKEAFNIFVEINFRDNTKLNDVSGNIGFVAKPVAVFELRAGIVLNPQDILDLRGEGTPITINQKYEAFVGLSFLIQKSFRISTSTRFNDQGTLSRYSVILAIPLRTIK